MEPPLERADEPATYLVTHYVAKYSMDAPTRARTYAVLDASGACEGVGEAVHVQPRARRALCAVRAACCSECNEYGPEARKRELAADALFLFDMFLKPVEGTAPWGHSGGVVLEVQRSERGALVLVSKCRLHKLELYLFHNMDCPCLGFAYRGPTDFLKRTALIGSGWC
jgi:hypothetical protein